MATLLQDEPRWVDAAQALVDGCLDLARDEDRVALLAGVCQRLGDELYPAFLRLLSLISRHGDHPARAAVAQALVHALRTGRLPSGRRGAWGSGAGAGAPAAATTTGGAWGGARSLGPIEYLCAWHGQAEGGLATASFESAARSVMELVDAHPEARALYCGKLLADVDDPLGGALTRQTRQALRAMASAWAAGAAPVDATARFVEACQGGEAGAPWRPPAPVLGLPDLLARRW